MAGQNRHTSKRSKPAGFTYIEVLVAVAVLAVCLVPAMEALRSSTVLLGIQNTINIDTYSLLSKTEEVLKENFTDLDSAAVVAGSPTTPTSYSDDIVTSDGRKLSRNVYIWPFDGDNADADVDMFTGTDAGILYVKVALANTDLFYETLVIRQ